MSLISIEEHINKMSFELGRDLFRYTPMIFSNKAREKLISSSLLLKFDQDHFLAMAAHTLKYNDLRNLGVLFGNTFVSIGGYNAVSNINEIEKDKIDIAIVKLDNEFVNHLPDTHFQFFDLEKVNIDGDDIDGYNYILFGYPLVRSKIKTLTKKIRIEPFNFRTNVISNELTYERNGIHQRSHQLLYYRKRKVNDGFSGNIIAGPRPLGMSGCGVWCVPDFNHPLDKLPFFPTGIVIEFDEKKSFFIATRLRVVTEILRQRFNPDIPASKKIDFHISKTTHVPFPDQNRVGQSMNNTKKI